MMCGLSRACARALRRSLFTLTLVALIASGDGQAIAAPPPLMGEVFTGDPSIRNVACNVVATPSPHIEGSFDYEVVGVAAGPYPGVFSESGSVTVSGLGRYTVRASFQITSPVGTVTGTKREVPNGAASSIFASCASVNGVLDSIILVGAAVRHEATIQTTEGTFSDKGTGILSATAEKPVAGPAIGTFSESFLVSALQPTFPAIKDQCKGGGWRAFGIFKNQGQCVSIVSHVKTIP